MMPPLPPLRPPLISLFDAPRFIFAVFRYCYVVFRYGLFFAFTPLTAILRHAAAAAAIFATPLMALFATRACRHYALFSLRRYY